MPRSGHLGSSSSSGGEGKKPRDQDVEVEQLRRQQRVEKEQGVQGDSTRRESGLEEDWNMEVDEEVGNEKKLDEQRCSRTGRKTWKEELQEIEKKRNERTSACIPEDAEKCLKRCKVCRIRTGIFSTTTVFVMKRCERSERQLMKERQVSWSWRRSHGSRGL